MSGQGLILAGPGRPRHQPRDGPADAGEESLHPEGGGSGVMAEGSRDWLRLPVVTAGSEEKAQIRVQVKSRYATDCDRGFPVKEKSLDAFDYLIVVFLNIGNFYGRNDGSSGARDPEFFTLSQAFIREHHEPSSTWEKVRLKKLEDQIQPFKNEEGFEQIANALGVPRPQKIR